MSPFSRRDILKSAGIAGAAAVVTSPGETQAQEQLSHQGAPAEGKPASAAQQAAQSTSDHEDVLFFFNQDEAKFVRAAVDRLIPADDQWAGADVAGVLYYIDRQLAGAYGAGVRMYLKGAWQPEAPPQQGYQLRYSPAELYRAAIPEILEYVRQRQNGRNFWDLSPSDMDAVLSALESGEAGLPSMPSPVFFETLLANTIEGYFADPAYGGNRGMVSWRMIGFPGAYAQYVGLVDQHGLAFTREPLSIATSYADLAHERPMQD